MTQPAIQTKWDERLNRATQLGKVYPFAAEVLDFYKAIAGFQKNFDEYLQSCGYGVVGPCSRLPEELDPFILLPKLRPFLQLVQESAPKALCDSAHELEAYGPERWSRLLSRFWRESEAEAQAAPAEQFVLRAFLQPVAEYLAERAEFDRSTNYAQALCPFCNRKPALGILRPEGDGAKRSLMCSLCSSEWQYRRIVCPGCGETEIGKLPVFTAAEFEYVRVECCDTCMRFIKTVDLTKQGHASPIVDELATLPLTLWANEKGYSKLAPNLLGM